jgi:hypothetical protein
MVDWFMLRRRVFGRFFFGVLGKLDRVGPIIMFFFFFGLWTKKGGTRVVVYIPILLRCYYCCEMRLDARMISFHSFNDHNNEHTDQCR